MFQHTEKQTFAKPSRTDNEHITSIALYFVDVHSFINIIVVFTPDAFKIVDALRQKFYFLFHNEDLLGKGNEFF